MESNWTGQEMETLGEQPEISFDNLYPVLLQTFVVIVMGYFSGRWGIIGSVEGKGLNTFVGTFALPTIIFTALAELDFSRVNWMFLLSMLISKLTVFVVVIVFTLLLTRPCDWAKAGLFAIFCTQSNDFALGYPIVAAVYGGTHPEYAKYLYVMAPISLVVLNPLGFLCLEIGERRKASQRLSNATASTTSADGNKDHKVLPLTNKTRSQRASSFKLVLSVWKNMVFTPIVLMTVLGIVANFWWQHEIPDILKNLCGVLSSAFSATALFALGLRMVGKNQELSGAKLVVPGLLIAVKCLVLPILTREVAIHMDFGNSANSSLELSNLGFLLGTFPTAPGVLFYAIQYNVAVDMVASAMVACTFISAPLTFVSARMVSLSSANPADYVQLLDGFLLPVAITGLVSTLFVLAIFLASKRWKKVPHFASIQLVLSQAMACLGVIVWYWCDMDTAEKAVAAGVHPVESMVPAWMHHMQFCLFVTGVFSSRIWSALLGVTLLLLRKKSVAFILKFRPVLITIGWGIPLILAVSMCNFATTPTVSLAAENPNFKYGKTQALVAASVLVISFLVTVISLVLQQRSKKRPHMPRRTASVVSTMSILSMSSGSSSDLGSQRNPSFNGSMARFPHPPPLSRSSSMVMEAFISDSVKPYAPLDTLFSASDDMPAFNIDMDDDSQLAVMNPRKRVTRQLTEPEESAIVRDRDDEFQIIRHVILLLALACSMFVGIALCVWTLVVEELTGIYVMLLFLDETLNFGQGIFVLVLFGLEPRRLLTPVWTGLKKQIKVPTGSKLRTTKDQENHTCEQFMMFYMDKCISDLVCDRRWQLKQYSNVFCGEELVDWLLLMGLSRDRGQAEKYGQTLLTGGIICHVDGRKAFHDQPYFYAFY